MSLTIAKLKRALRKLDQTEFKTAYAAREAYASLVVSCIDLLEERRDSSRKIIEKLVDQVAE